MIHHEVTGDRGDWLVFVHGLTCALSDWRKQVEALSGHWRCLGVDLRGHGQSAAMPPPYDMETLAGDVVELMHRLGIERAVLVGHSMGTRVISAAHLQAPELVRGLVFVDGSKQGEGEAIAARDQQQAFLTTQPDFAGFVDGMFDMMFTERSRAADRDTIVARAVDMPPDRIRALMTSMAAWDAGRMAHALSLIKVPVTVVQSTMVSPERVRTSLAPGATTPYLDLLRQVLPQARIDVVEHTGHFTQLDAATRVNEAIASLATEVFGAPVAKH